MKNISKTTQTKNKHSDFYDRLKNRRPTIGWLGNEDVNAFNLWSGVAAVAQEHDANLIYFDIDALNSPVGFRAQSNVLYDLAGRENIDGLISWQSSVVSYLTPDEAKQFFKRYAPLPIVGVGIAVEGVPSVLLDNYQGMYDVIVHLIEVHGCRRIAFIRGPEDHPEAEERYRAYVEALTRYNIPFENDLVAPGTFEIEWASSIAREAISRFFDRQPIDVEAVVAATDAMACAALEALRARGLRVPDDVAVVGFDDIPKAGYSTSPLTTARQPFYEMGRQAAEVLFTQIEGKPVPEQTIVSSTLIIRRSCGCAEPPISWTPEELVKVAGKPHKAAVTPQRENILNVMVQAGELHLNREHVGVQFTRTSAEHLLDAFWAELEGTSPGAFSFALERELWQKATRKGNMDAWLNALSAMRCAMLPCFDDIDTLYRAEQLWQQALILIGKTAQRIHKYQQLQAEEHARIFREIGQTLMMTFHLEDLLNILVRELPRLGIPGCYLSVYEDPQPYHYPQPAPAWSRLLLAYNEQGRVTLKPEGERFPSRQFLPEDVLLGERPYNFILVPLFFQKEQIGLALFEMGPQESSIYYALRGQISSALQGAMLVGRIQEHLTELARTNAELAREKYVIDTFMATVPDLIYFKDLESRITKANKAHAIRLGFNGPAEEVGKTDFDFFPEEQARIKYEQEQEIIRTGQPQINLEEQISWSDGKTTWFLATKMPLRDEHGEIIGTFGISRDITAMKQVEEELRQYREHLQDLVAQRTAELTRINALLNQEIVERKHIERDLRLSEQQYRLLAENVMDGVVIVQADKLVFVNRGFATIVQHPIDQLLQGDILRVFPAHEHQHIRERLIRADGDPAIPAWQAEILTGDKDTIWIEVSHTKIMWESQPALLLTIRDIHANKLREQQLEQERARLHQENLTFKSTLSERYRFGKIVGKSAVMQQIYALIINAAAADVNVLVYGESGTGKELIAQTIHQVSARKQHPFIPVNCASIPESLFEREFFGHRKGAFTGADRDRTGLFDRAHQGTLFLDEVTELSHATQAKLLRVLQDGKYLPLGSTTPKKADVLVIAATNKEWKPLIEQGLLRKDFFYRICVVEIRVPPLRDRKEDMPLLIEHALEQYRQKQKDLHGRVPDDLPGNQTALPGELVQALYAYHWPGNVRELQNVLQRYLVTRDLEAILSLLGVSVTEHPTLSIRTVSKNTTLPQAVETLERQMITGALAQNRYHISNTAKTLGIPRITLHRKIKKYQLFSDDK